MPMTAQDDNSVNLNYPVQGPVVASPAPTTVAASQPVAPAPLQSVDDLDPNRGQQISGPSFDSLSNEIPTEPAIAVPSPFAGNMTGSMQDLVPPQISPLQPDPTVQDFATTSEPLVTPVEVAVSAPSPSMPVIEETPVVEATEPEEKKESPLQTLARKLAELKSELIEETPDESDTPPVVETPMVTNPTVDSAPVSEMSDMSVPSPTPDLDLQAPSSLSDTTDVSEVVSADVPVIDEALDQLSATLPNGGSLSPDEMEIAIPTLTDTTVQDQVVEDVVQSPVMDDGTGTMTENVPTVETVSEVVQSPAIENTVEEVPVETPPVDPLSEYQAEVQGTANTPVASEPVTATVAPTADSGVIDENIKEDITTEEVEESTPSSGKYPLNINKILDLAIDRNASDVHISVGYPVMIRIDGSLVAVHEQILSSENAEELVFPLLSEQKKELLEVNREIDFAHTHRHGGEARFRINAFYTRQNLAAALRLIPTRIKTIEELMLPAIYTQFASLKQGLVLVTGPTGHGKSTTLAAILQHVNVNRSVHLLTIEDPIEYIFPKARAVVDQREMHDDTHSWSVALKSALRQDPDVILVGEMRDFETIAATITLAETGHLVFATLHTNSASQTIDRIIDVFPENQQAQVRAQLSNILEAVIAQRLLPIDGGGRRAVSEIMIGSGAVRNLIREGKTHQLDNVIRTSADIGMVSLEHSLVKLVREGLITMDKAQEYAVHPEEVVRLLKS